MSTKRKSHGLLTILGATLISLGLGLIGFTYFFPDEAEKAAGTARIASGEVLMKVKGQKYPKVHLGAKGHIRELDRCDGTFIEMGAYETDGLQPVYAAHNNCKGDVILKLEVDDIIDIKDKGQYKISDIRHTKKTWSTTDEILGMEGEFILQSCYYGENRMKFISMTPIVAEDSELSS